MKKITKRDQINLIFSAFLIIAFVVCGYFFSTLAQTMPAPWNTIVTLAVFVLFGVVLFYATRVGEGKQIIRFSISSLILVVLPSLYIILASTISQLPLYEQISQNLTIVVLACVALGYGLPYTFMSGFELDTEENTEEIPADTNEDEVSEEEAPAEEIEETPAEDPTAEDVPAEETPAAE